MSTNISVQDIDPSIWSNVASFLHPFEQCRMLVLCRYLQQLTVPQHNFVNDIQCWQDNFQSFAEFGFADINVKDKITTLSIDNGLFQTLTNKQCFYLLYFLKYHSKIAILYQPKVEQVLNEEIDDYAGEFYKEIKFLYSLNIGDNNSINPFLFIIKYIESMTIESSVLKVKKCALLKEVYLNDNNLDDECLLLFCETIKNNLMKWGNLRTLDLSDNKNISDKYMPLFLESVVMDTCDGLDYLGLESTSIGDDTIDCIYVICQKYPKKVWIKRLNIQFNDNVTEKGVEKLTSEGFKDKFPEIAQQMKIQI